MKKILLIAGLMFASFAQAQDYIITTDGGAEITENQEFLFNVYNNAPAGNSDVAKVHILIKNNTQATHNFGIKVNAITNNNVGEDGDGKAQQIQLCMFELCYPKIVGDKIYPTVGAVDNFILPGQTNNPSDHFVNGWAGDTPGQPVTYTFSIMLMDDPENPIAIRNFRYKYDPTAGLNDFGSLQNIGITVNNTVVKNLLDVTATVNANLEVYSISGQSVTKAAIANGAQSVDLSSLSAGVYVAKFVTEDNRAAQIKIVKN